MELLLLYFFIAIGVSFICSILEAVILSTNSSYISVLEKENPKGGKILKKVKTNINDSISAILILNTTANTLGAAGVGMQAEVVFGGSAVFYVSAILTFCILFFSEIIPKTIGTVHWKKLAILTGYLINIFVFITAPVRFFTRYVTDKISKGSEANGLTREEFIHQTLLSEDEGIIDEKESDVIENVLHLDEIKVRDILTPRRVMYAISLDDTIEEILADEKIYNFSRIPVMGEDIDDIIGIALSKKIFQKAMENKKTKINKLTQDIYKINENIPVSKALDLFIKRKEHMFLVVDGYNQTEGIITLEDCIETLLGVEIMDESDTHEDMRELAKKDMKKDRETEI